MESQLLEQFINAIPEFVQAIQNSITYKPNIRNELNYFEYTIPLVNKNISCYIDWLRKSKKAKKEAGFSFTFVLYNFVLPNRNLLCYLPKLFIDGYSNANSYYSNEPSIFNLIGSFEDTVTLFQKSFGKDCIRVLFGVDEKDIQKAYLNDVLREIQNQIDKDTIKAIRSYKP